MAGFRYPYDIVTTMDPWREKLGSDYEGVVAHLADRDRQLEDFLSTIDPVGRVVAWAAPLTAVVPRGWLVIDGSAKSRTGPTAQLFALLGTTYGIGDGSTTFNLPNVTQGRVLAGYDAGVANFNAIGLTGGSKDASVITHSHSHAHGITVDGNNFNSGGETANHTHVGTTDGINQNHTHGGKTQSPNAGHGHDTTDAQFAGRPTNVSAFTGGNGTDINNVGHTHTFTTAGVSGDHAHNVNHAHTGSSAADATASGVSGTGANLPPYITMRFLIRY